ncbi:TIGR04222 domain-containing membrane protein [Streptomyces sp. NPDC058662]|uniref:TIGR04222 domain-containing membrane protein n=1 Tax=Streptomyces sp. NPDC058662 TaxID=3346583 RepID=UPI003664EB55
MNLLALAVWLAVVTCSVLLVRGPRRSRPTPPGPAPRLHDLSEAAFLTGGPGAVVDAALVSLLGDGRLLLGGPGIVHVRPGARAGDPAERAVLEAHRGAPSGWLYQVRYAAMRDPAVQETGDGLAARGLVAPPSAGRPWQRRGTALAVVCAFLVPLSLPLTFIGYAVGPPSQIPFIVKVLPVLLVGVAVGAVRAARAGRRITPAGRLALGEIRARYVNDPHPYVRAALFGLRGLPDDWIRRQLTEAARGTRLAAAQSASRARGARTSGGGCGVEAPAVWCAGSDGGGGGSGCGSGSGSGSGSSGGGCGSSGSSCSSSSSSCGSSSGSSCSSSSSS